MWNLNFLTWNIYICIIQYLLSGLIFRAIEDTMSFETSTWWGTLIWVNYWTLLDFSHSLRECKELSVGGIFHRLFQFLVLWLKFLRHEGGDGWLGIYFTIMYTQNKSFSPHCAFWGVKILIVVTGKRNENDGKIFQSYNVNFPNWGEESLCKKLWGQNLNETGSSRHRRIYTFIFLERENKGNLYKTTENSGDFTAAQENFVV